MSNLNTLMGGKHEETKGKTDEEIEKEEEEYLKAHPKICNELADYNLLLYRQVYDAYGDKADKVAKNFRKANNNVLRKRYVQSVINPNYDYDKLMREIEQNKVAKETKEEEPVKLDGEEVEGGQDKQEVKSKTESGNEEELKKKEREMIDRFGNKIDPSKQEVSVVMP